jgi:hypothetical protein
MDIECTDSPEKEDIFEDALDHVVDGIAAVNVAGDGNFNVNAPNVGLESIQDSMVAEQTRCCYVTEIFSIIFWLRNENAHVLTPHGTLCMDSKIELYPEYTPKILYKKFKVRFQEELRDCNINPLFLNLYSQRKYT